METPPASVLSRGSEESGAVAGELEQLQRKLALAAEQNRELSGKLDEALATRAAVEKRLMEADAQNLKMKQAAVAYGVFTQRWTRRAVVRIFKRTAGRVAILVGASIPFVGIPVNVAATTLDVREACTDMKELNSLNAEFDLPSEDENRVCGLKVPPKEDVIKEIKDNWKVAYESAAKTINETEIKIPVTPPKVDWQSVKDQVCAVVGPVRIVCP